MKRMSSLFVAFILMTSLLKAEETASIPKNSLEPLKTIGLGIGIGAATGYICDAIETKVKGSRGYWPLSWVVSIVVRKMMVSAATKINGSSVDETIMADSAWLSEWVTYLIIARKRNVLQPIDEIIDAGIAGYRAKEKHKDFWSAYDAFIKAIVR